MANQLQKYVTLSVDTDCSDSSRFDVSSATDIDFTEANIVTNLANLQHSSHERDVDWLSYKISNKPTSWAEENPLMFEEDTVQLAWTTNGLISHAATDTVFDFKHNEVFVTTGLFEDYSHAATEYHISVGESDEAVDGHVQTTNTGGVWQGDVHHTILDTSHGNDTVHNQPDYVSSFEHAVITQNTHDNSTAQDVGVAQALSIPLFHSGAPTEALYPQDEEMTLAGADIDLDENDVFIWSKSYATQFGASTVEYIHGFRFNAEGVSDLVCFDDLFEDEESLTELFHKAFFDQEERKLSFEFSGGSFEAQFISSSDLRITITDAENMSQSLHIHADNGCFIEDLNQLDLHASHEILLQMIKDRIV